MDIKRVKGLVVLRFEDETEDHQSNKQFHVMGADLAAWKEVLNTTALQVIPDRLIENGAKDAWYDERVEQGNVCVVYSIGPQNLWDSWEDVCLKAFIGLGFTFSNFGEEAQTASHPTPDEQIALDDFEEMVDACLKIR